MLQKNMQTLHKYADGVSGTKSDIRRKGQAQGARCASAHTQARVRVGELELQAASWARKLSELGDGDGLTLRAGREVSYKTGWQVADYGYECTSAQDAAKKICEMGENCGVWYSNGIYYIDHSFRVNTKREAMRIGREHKQISVLKWSNMTLAYC